MTLLRVFFGFLLGMFAGTLLGVLTAVSGTAEAFLSPLRHVIRSTPVTSFIVLVLLYLSNTLTPMFIPMVMVTPIAWGSVQAGIKDTDRQLLEMAGLCRFSRSGRLRYIYLPSILPQYLSASTNALGIAWKSGIAAEVIATPALSIGRSIYESKIYLETPSLFAWTAAVILLSVLMEKLILRLFGSVRENRLVKLKCVSAEIGEEKKDKGLSFSNISVSYEEKSILKDVSADVSAGGVLAVLGASGSGKTTLLRVLCGLVKPQSGKVDVGECACVFQEDRLLPWFTMRQNMQLVCRDEARISELLSLVELDEEAFDKLPAELSGGMQRRLALARALACGGDVLFLDEAFKGVDEACKMRIIKRIKGLFPVTVVVTHDEREAEALSCTKKLYISAQNKE